MPINVFDPVFGQFPSTAANATPNTNREEVLEGFGFYIQDQIEVTDNFQIRIGGRFDDFEQELTDFGNTSISEDTRFSPQVGAVYLINEGVSVFASYGEGFRQQTGSDFLGNQLDPNITESAELGVKVDVGALTDNINGSINLAFFDVDQSPCLLYTSPSPRDGLLSRMPSSA